MAPVSFKCVAVDTIEERFFVLDETCLWLHLGQSSLGRKALCPTGLGYVAVLARGESERSVCAFLLSSGDYPGIATMNFLPGET
jgi:hypothetical protein